MKMPCVLCWLRRRGGVHPNCVVFYNEEIEEICETFGGGVLEGFLGGWKWLKQGFV